MDRDVKYLVEWEFEDPIFPRDEKMSELNSSDEFSDDEFISVLASYFEITEITELKDIALLRRDLLDYISSFKAYEEDETILVSQILRIALIFQTTPLSDSEMEKLKLVKIDQNNLAQLMALGTDKRILKLNEQLLPIFTKRSEDIPLMDTSEIPFIGMNVVCSIFRVLTNSLQFFKSPFLRTARNNFGIAVPKILFTNQLHDVIDCLEYVVETFQSEAPLMNLFYKAFKNRFTFRQVYLLGSEFLTTYAINQKKMIAKICKAKAAMPEMFNAEMEEMVQQIIESANMNSAQCLIAAMTFAVYSNKQQNDSYDTGAKLMMSMLMVISKHDEALLAFLRNLDLERLLYKMKSLFLEFAAPNNRNVNTADEFFPMRNGNIRFCSNCQLATNHVHQITSGINSLGQYGLKEVTNAVVPSQRSMNKRLKICPAASFIYAEKRKKLDNISRAMKEVLIERLAETLSPAGLKKKLACMLIEHITLWTDSASLMIDLALRWATFTDYALHAVKVIDLLIILVTAKPHFLTHPDEDHFNNVFLKRTCMGVFFNRNKFLFIDWAIALKKRKLQMLELAPPISIDRDVILDTITETSQLRTFFISTYFHTPESDLQKGRLFSSYHNLHSEDLTNPTINNLRNELGCITVYRTNIDLASNTQHTGGNQSTVKFISATKLYADKGFWNKRNLKLAFDCGFVERTQNRLENNLLMISCKKRSLQRVHDETSKAIRTATLTKRICDVGGPIRSGQLHVARCSFSSASAYLRNSVDKRADTDRSQTVV